MTLVNAVTMGRFCGLTTVEECISNVERHSMSLFKYTEITKELNELALDYKLYKAKKLILDFETIDRKNQEEMDNWIEQEKNQNFDESEDLDFDFND